MFCAYSLINYFTVVVNLVHVAVIENLFYTEAFKIFNVVLGGVIEKTASVKRAADDFPAVGGRNTAEVAEIKNFFHIIILPAFSIAGTAPKINGNFFFLSTP